MKTIEDCVNKIHCGDASKLLKEMPPRFVDLIICSPPYNLGKGYDNYDDNKPFEEYIKFLDKVWKECFRVLKHGGRLCINIYDVPTRTKTFGRHLRFPNHAFIIASCFKLGFDYMDSIHWYKVGNCNPSGGASLMGSYPFPSNGIIKVESEYIMVFKKPGNKKRPDNLNEKDRLTKKEWYMYFSDYWNFPGASQRKGHPAVFPEKLPHRLIKMFSFTGDIVLDPFVGIGSTCMASKKLDRKYIGIDISPIYTDICKKRLNNIEKSLNNFKL